MAGIKKGFDVLSRGIVLIRQNSKPK